MTATPREIVERLEALVDATSLADQLTRLEALAARGALDADELAQARRRALAAAPVADVRAIGPARRGRTLAISFDGGLCPPASARLPLDEVAPRDGAIDWLERAVERFDVAVVGSRVDLDGAEPLRAWLAAAGLSPHALARVRFPSHKPPADVYLDARAMRFVGAFPSAAEVAAHQRDA